MLYGERQKKPGYDRAQGSISDANVPYVSFKILPGVSHHGSYHHQAGSQSVERQNSHRNLVLPVLQNRLSVIHKSPLSDRFSSDSITYCFRQKKEAPVMTRVSHICYSGFSVAADI